MKRKKYRIREGSIAEKAIFLYNKIDEEPYATAVYMITMFIMMAMLVFAIDSEYPR